MELQCGVLPCQCKRNKRRIRILETTCHDLNLNPIILRRRRPFFASTPQPIITVVLPKCVLEDFEVFKVVAMALNRCAFSSYRPNRFLFTQSSSTKVVAMSRNVPTIQRGPRTYNCVRKPLEVLFPNGKSQSHVRNHFQLRIPGPWNIKSATAGMRMYHKAVD